MTEIRAYAPCLLCGYSFAFDPDTVPSLAFDPVTQLPPDLGGDPERAVSQPICSTCLLALNEIRARQGLDPVSPRTT